MKVTLIQNALGRKIGAEMNISPSRAKHYMKLGIVAKDEEFLKNADSSLGCGPAMRKPVTKKNPIDKDKK